MALITEDGSGLAEAESYANVEEADAYWQNRPNLALSATWLASGAAVKEGALREATTYLDATWGRYYRGKASGGVQGLLWPRTDAVDAFGNEIANLPREIVQATIELAARAIIGALSVDTAAVNAESSIVQKAKAGPVDVSFQDTTSLRINADYGSVAGILDPVLNGLQRNSATWNWQ